MTAHLEGWCVGHGRHAHFPDGGLTVARVSPYGTAVLLCRDCFRSWRADDGEACR